MCCFLLFEVRSCVELVFCFSIVTKTASTLVIFIPLWFHGVVFERGRSSAFSYSPRGSTACWGDSRGTLCICGHTKDRKKYSCSSSFDLIWIDLRRSRFALRKCSHSFRSMSDSLDRSRGSHSSVRIQIAFDFDLTHWCDQPQWFQIVLIGFTTSPEPRGPWLLLFFLGCPFWCALYISIHLGLSLFARMRMMFNCHRG